MAVTLVPDVAGWTAQVRSVFGALETELLFAAGRTQRRSEEAFDSIYQSGLNRPYNAGRDGFGGRKSLLRSIPESVHPITSAIEVGVGFGEQAQLDAESAHWRAIELGSDHIIGTKLVAFGARTSGGGFQKSLDLGADTVSPDAIAANADNTGGVRVTRPIRAHNYIRDLAKRGTEIFVKQEMPTAFSRAGFNR